MAKTKRGNEATKAAAASSSSKKIKFDKEAVDLPNFCSDPRQGLTDGELGAVLAVHRSNVESDQVSILLEKELIGKGTKKLYMIKDKDGLVFVFDGKKCVKKDLLRIDALVETAIENEESARQEEIWKGDGEPKAHLVLLGEAGICKRNTLPQLVEAGYVIQRAQDE